MSGEKNGADQAKKSDERSGSVSGLNLPLMAAKACRLPYSTVSTMQFALRTAVFSLLKAFLHCMKFATR